MIGFALDHANDVVLIRFDEDINRETLTAFDAKLRLFVARHGLVDVIMDFTHARAPIDSTLVVDRGRSASLVPGRRRVFVAPSDHLYGMLRMYGAYQDEQPILVRTPEQAIRALGLESPSFAPC
jgi:hypothetical protein